MIAGMDTISALNKKASFSFSLKFEDAHYSGIVTPSADTDKFGMPVYFRVQIGNKFFAYLCCGELGWSKKDNKEEDSGDSGLIHAIGGAIKRHYE